MKIGIDVFGLEHGKSGIGSYVISLVENLPLADEYEYELFGHEIDRYTFDSRDGKVGFVGIDIGDDPRLVTMWHKFKLKKFAKKQKYDTVLFPSSSLFGKLSSKIESVIVFHAGITKQFESAAQKKIYKTRLKYARKATKIIVVSQQIKKDLTQLKIDAKKIEVVYNGVDHLINNDHIVNTSHDLGDDIAYIKPFAIKKPYIIYASRLSNSEKKHIELINAFCDFKKRTGLPHRLVLAGNEEKYAEKIHTTIESCDFASDILVIGYFPRESFFELYAQSDASVFPSVSEGIGLPVVEAMATGIPVACSKQGSLHEMAGDFALYFDPDNIEDFSNAIEQVVTDSELREKLIKDGTEWTKRFSWEKTANRTIDVIKTLNK